MTPIIVLASGIPFGFKDMKPKSLIELSDDYTILDFQMNQFGKRQLYDVTFVVGWRGDEVVDYCKEKKYDNVRFVWDYAYERRSVSQGFKELKDFLLQCPSPLVTIFCDQLWDDLAFNNILGCKGDWCRIRWTHGLMKFSKKGIEEYLNVICDNNIWDINEAKPIIIERNKINYVEIQNGLILDVDNIEHLVKAKKIWGKKKRYQ